MTRRIVKDGQQGKKRQSVKVLAALPFVLKNPTVVEQNEDNSLGYDPNEDIYQYECIPWKTFSTEELLSFVDSKEAMLINLMPLTRSDAWLQSLYDHCLENGGDYPDYGPRLPSGLYGWETTDFGDVLHLNLDLKKYPDTKEQKDIRFVAVPLTLADASFVLESELRTSVSRPLHLPSGQLTPLQMEELLFGLHGWRTGFTKSPFSEEEVAPSPPYSAVKEVLNNPNLLSAETIKGIVKASKTEQAEGETSVPKFPFHVTHIHARRQA